MNTREARDASRDRTDDIADRWLADGLASADVTAAAREAAEAAIRQQDKISFEDRVNAALDQKAADAAVNQEGN